MDEEDGETFTVRLSDPDNATLKAGGETATGTIDDNDGAPEVSIKGAPVVVEGTAAAFVVELSTESRKTVTVSYATADGTALASEDYTAVAATTLEFTSGQTAKTISVATTVDGLDEEDGETFTVRLSDPGNATLKAGGETATGTIDDNDGAPEVSITGAPVVVEGTAAAFVVELSTESRKTVTVSYATADGTALASEDYTAVLATELEFTSGQTAQTISVATTVDGLDEADGETFTVRLSDPDNATLKAGGETATGTIDDNDGAPEVSITGAPVVVEGTAAAFVVELSTESRKTVTVSYATADGTALASEDYTAVLATELEFTSGQTAQTISVATTVDGLDEADGETFTVRLSDPDNATLKAGGETATGTIDDNDGAPEVSITGAPVVVEGTAAAFVVELSTESRKTVTVSYATADGTALASEDYTAVLATELEFTSDRQTISVATTTGWTRKTERPSRERSRERDAEGRRRDGDGDDQRQRRCAGGEHHGSAGGGRGDRGGVRGGAEHGEPQDGDGELRDGDGTALASEDYTAVAATTLEFTSGQRARRSASDGLDEEDGETFTVTLSSREGRRRDGDGDDRRQRRRAGGEHHGSAGGGRGDRGGVRGGAEHGEPQDGDGELRDGGRHGAGERGLHGGGGDDAGVHLRTEGEDDQRSDDGRRVGRGRRRDLHGDVELPGTRLKAGGETATGTRRHHGAPEVSIKGRRRWSRGPRRRSWWS